MDNIVNLKLMVQGPRNIYCYFNVTEEVINEFNNIYGENSFQESNSQIKVFKLSNGEELEVKTINIDPFANNWFVNIEESGVDVIVKLGKENSVGFIPIGTSNIVSLPRDYASNDYNMNYKILNENYIKGSKDGYISLILHSHLPYVRHIDKDDALEERWLLEAMIECYLPLIQSFLNLKKEGVDFKITLSLTPTLLEMLNDEYLNDKFLNHMKNMIKLTTLEIKRTKEEKDVNKLGKFYNKRYKELLEIYKKYDCNIINAFKAFDKSKNLEIITSSATHAILPFMETNIEALYAQIEQGVKTYTKYIGHAPKGIWLPECAYTYSIDKVLKDLGIEYFILEDKGIKYASPYPKFENHSPLSTLNGIFAFGRDIEASSQIWSSQYGYPGDINYREFYRDIAYTMPLDYIAPFIQKDGIRIDTGIKYNKITGNTEEKGIYDRDIALEVSDNQASHFCSSRYDQIKYLSSLAQDPIVVCAFDTELFGHWWFEGPDFLKGFMKKSSEEWANYSLTTPSEYLKKIKEVQISSPNPGSWGENSDFSVWLNMKNHWIYRDVHELEIKMVEVAEKNKLPRALKKRALNQLARELMLLESSDWAFIIKNESTVKYALGRIKDHKERFQTLYNMILKNKIDEEYLSSIEVIDNIFKDMDYKIYRKRVE